MITLTNTKNITHNSPKELKKYLNNNPIKVNHKLLSEDTFIQQLSTSYALFTSTHLSSDVKWIMSNKKYAGVDQNDENSHLYTNTQQIDQLSHTKCLDIEIRPVDAKYLYGEDLSWYPFLDPAHPIPPKLTLELVLSRVAKMLNNKVFYWQYSDSSTQHDLRLHVYTQTEKRISHERWREVVMGAFPELVITNEHHVIRKMALYHSDEKPLDFGGFTPKPLFVDIVSFNPKQRIYLSSHPIHKVGFDGWANLHKHRVREANTPLNLIRGDLVEAFVVDAVGTYGSIEKARVHYEEHGDKIPRDKLLYAADGELLGGAFDAAWSEENYGRPCNFGPDCAWFRPDYAGKWVDGVAVLPDGKSAYLQVGREGGLFYHSEQVHLAFEAPPPEGSKTVVFDKYIDRLPLDIIHHREGLLGPVGSGKTTSFSPGFWASKVMVMVPNNSQVLALAGQNGWVGLVNTEKKAEQYADEDYVLSDMVEAMKHSHVIATYDKVAYTYNDFDGRLAVADEIHEFLMRGCDTPSGLRGLNDRREELFVALFRQDTVHSVFNHVLSMSGTMPMTSFADLDPNQRVVKYVSDKKRPITILTNGFTEDDFISMISAGKMVIYINHNRAAAGFAELALGGGLSVGRVWGKMEDSPQDVIDSQPDLLLISSTAKQGFDISYRVENYVCYLAASAIDTYGKLEVDQIAGRCRDVGAITLLYNRKRFLDKPKDIPIPTTGELAQAVKLVMDAENSPQLGLGEATRAKVELQFISGFYDRLKHTILTKGDSTELAISRRAIVGLRLKLIGENQLSDISTMSVNGGKVVVDVVKVKKKLVSPWMPLGEREPIALLRKIAMTLESLDDILNEYNVIDVDGNGPDISAAEGELLLKIASERELLANASPVVVAECLDNERAMTGYKLREQIFELQALAGVEIGKVMGATTWNRKLLGVKGSRIRKLVGMGKAQFTNDDFLDAVAKKLHLHWVWLDESGESELVPMKWSRANARILGLAEPPNGRNNQKVIGYSYEGKPRVFRKDDAVVPMRGAGVKVKDGCAVGCYHHADTESRYRHPKKGKIQFIQNIYLGVDDE